MSKEVAMGGEVTLRGLEPLIAALLAGIKTIPLPKLNEKTCPICLMR